jgi:hypothetical protein
VVADLLAMRRAPGTGHAGHRVAAGRLAQGGREGKALQFASAVAVDEKSVLDYNRGVLAAGAGAGTAGGEAGSRGWTRPRCPLPPSTRPTAASSRTTRSSC